jgi:rubrerythrin
MGGKILLTDTPALIARRRGLFTLGALAATGLAQSALAKGAASNGDAAILNTALALEFQAIAAYQVGAESKLLDKPVLDLAVQFQSHHKAHAAALTVAIEQSGGVAVESKTIADYAFPVEQLKSQADVLRFAAGLEKAAASAYVNSLANLRQKSLIKGAAAILGDETMHWAVLLNALGENPVPAAFIS